MTGTLVCIVSLLYAFKFSRTSNSPQHLRLHFDNSILATRQKSLSTVTGLYLQFASRHQLNDASDDDDAVLDAFPENQITNCDAEFLISKFYAEFTYLLTVGVWSQNWGCYGCYRVLGV